MSHEDNNSILKALPIPPVNALAPSLFSLPYGYFKIVLLPQEREREGPHAEEDAGSTEPRGVCGGLGDRWACETRGEGGSSHKCVGII